MTPKMSEQTPQPTLAADRTERDRRTGRLLIGSGVTNLAAFVVIAMLLVLIMQVTTTNAALTDALTKQRDQFIACTDKPPSTRGCTQPVAAEPEVITKQGRSGPMGLTGPIGPQGPQGPTGARGPAGPPGAAGKTGPPPGCSLLRTACVGATGQQGAQGEQGPAGERGPQGEQGPAGERGPAGETGQQGAQGEMGVQGPRGVGTSSSQCVNDDTPNGSHWLITYSDGAQETSPGPCRVNLP
jgi:hypothetical protein